MKLNVQCTVQIPYWQWLQWLVTKKLDEFRWKAEFECEWSLSLGCSLLLTVPRPGAVLPIPEGICIRHTFGRWRLILVKLLLAKSLSGWIYHGTESELIDTESAKLQRSSCVSSAMYITQGMFTQQKLFACYTPGRVLHAYSCLPKLPWIQLAWVTVTVKTAQHGVQSRLASRVHTWGPYCTVFSATVTVCCVNISMVVVGKLE